jgi:acetyl esterase/lipase
MMLRILRSIPSRTQTRPKQTSSLLPWDGRTYDEKMSLSEVGALLPYHSAIDTNVIVNALNHMIRDAASTRTIFYDIYSQAARQHDKSKGDTGIFFIRGQPGAPFAIVAPGGGFSYVGSLHEGFPYAVEIAKAGFNAFVLKYRVGQGGRTATEDLAAAISYIVANAARLEVETSGYSLWGSSAGARMAAAIGTSGVRAFGGDDLPRPAVVIMAYTAHTEFSPPLVRCHEPTQAWPDDSEGAPLPFLLIPSYILLQRGAGRAF